MSLLSIPAELRIVIIQHVLNNTTITIQTVPRRLPWDDPRGRPTGIPPALLMVCKQLYEEGKNHIWDAMFILEPCLSLYDLDEEEYAPVEAGAKKFAMVGLRYDVLFYTIPRAPYRLKVSQTISGTHQSRWIPKLPGIIRNLQKLRLYLRCSELWDSWQRPKYDIELFSQWNFDLELVLVEQWDRYSNDHPLRSQKYDYLLINCNDRSLTVWYMGDHDVDGWIIAREMQLSIESVVVIKGEAPYDIQRQSRLLAWREHRI